MGKKEGLTGKYSPTDIVHSPNWVRRWGLRFLGEHTFPPLNNDFELEYESHNLYNYGGNSEYAWYVKFRKLYEGDVQERIGDRNLAWRRFDMETTTHKYIPEKAFAPVTDAQMQKKFTELNARVTKLKEMETARAFALVADGIEELREAVVDL